MHQFILLTLTLTSCIVVCQTAALPTDSPSYDAIECPPVPENCETRMRLMGDGITECEVCGLTEGQLCHVLDANLCLDGLKCFPPEWALEASMEEMAATNYTCQLASDYGLQKVDLSNLTEEEMLKLMDVLTAADENPSAYPSFEGLTLDEIAFLVVGERISTDVSPASSSEARKPSGTRSRSSGSKSGHGSKSYFTKRSHRNRYPRKFSSSETPCTNQLSHYREKSQNKRNHHWKPVCDSDGFYSTNSSQCSGATTCWCVDRFGLSTSNEIFRKKSNSRKCASRE